MIRVRHTSLNNNIEEFIPRVPKYRVLDENEITPRVCASDSFYNCVKSFPYGSSLVVDTCNKDVGTYLSVYDFYVPKKDILTPENVYRAGVPDAKKNNEYWITKKCKPYRKQIIRMVDFKMSNYNKYTWEYYGEITKMDYQYSIEPTPRILTDTIYDYKNCNKLKKLFNKLGIKILEESIKETYFGYGYNSEDYALPNHISKTKKKITKIKYKIPANIDAYYIWEMIIKDNAKFKKKKAQLLSEEFLESCKNI